MGSYISEGAESARITKLENNVYKITYYEIITGASGSITVPTNATINSGEFEGLNCILSEIDGNNKPTLVSPKTSGGVVVTSTLNVGTEAWVKSGTTASTNVALIYSINITELNYSNLNNFYILNEEKTPEFSYVLNNTTTGSVASSLFYNAIASADKTGTGQVVFSISPVFTGTPNFSGSLGSHVTPTHQVHYQLDATDNFFIDARTNPRNLTLGALRLEHTPAITGTRPINLDVNAAGFGDTHGCVIDYATGAISGTSFSNIHEVTVDGTNSTGGTINVFFADMIANGALNAVNALKVNPGINPIYHLTGTFVASDKSWSFNSNNSTYTDITSGTNQLFAHNGDIVYVGKTSGVFNDASFTISIPGNTSILPTFQYWNGSAWTAFSPTDGTNGFIKSGNVVFIGANLTGWASTTVNGVAGFYIRITRTKGSMTTVPTETAITLTTGSAYSWNKTGDVVVNSVNSSTSTLGMASATSLTSPSVIGGTAVGDALNLQGTSGNGTSTVAAINFKVGNAGGTTAGSIYNSGALNWGNAVSTGQRIVRIGENSAFIDIGADATNPSDAVLSMNQSSSPGSVNYTIRASSTQTYVSGPQLLRLMIAGNDRVDIRGVQTSGFNPTFSFITPNNTSQTLSTAIPQVLYTMGNTQWATGAGPAHQPFYKITQPTASAVGSSTFPLTSTFYIAGAPNSGSNMIQTITAGLYIDTAAVNGTGTAGTSYGAYINAMTGATTNWGLGVNGNINAIGNVTVNGTSGAGYVNLVAQGSNASAPSATGLNLFSPSTGDIAFAKKNGTDTFVRSLSSTLTADRTYTLQDKSDTLAGITDSYFIVSANTALFTPVSGTTYYFAAFAGVATNTTANIRKIVIPYNCTFIGASINIEVGGTLETVANTATFTLRANNSNLQQISNTITFTSIWQGFSATGFSNNMTAGDSIEVSMLAPTWTTSPTNVLINVQLYFARR